MAYLCELHGSVDHKTWHLTNMGLLSHRILITQITSIIRWNYTHIKQ